MRDERGRYINVKAIEDCGPKWGYGCDKCKHGIATAPDILGAFPLFEGRAVQAHEEMIIFCDCRAGFMYRQLLRKVYDRLSMETRRIVMQHIEAASVPTVHGVMA